MHALPDSEDMGISKARMGESISTQLVLEMNTVSIPTLTVPGRLLPHYISNKTINDRLCQRKTVRWYR